LSTIYLSYSSWVSDITVVSPDMAQLANIILQLFMKGCWQETHRHSEGEACLFSHYCAYTHCFSKRHEIQLHVPSWPQHVRQHSDALENILHSFEAR
jgi:hypothetical protein